MAADESLSLVQPKIERAKKHIIDLRGAIDAFGKTDPYTVSTNRHPHTRKSIYYVSRVDPVPLAVAAIAGDAIHNLRAALDYLIQHLLMVATNNDAPSKGKNYSFYIDGDPDPNHYKTSAPANVQRLRQDAIDTVRPPLRFQSATAMMEAFAHFAAAA